MFLTVRLRYRLAGIFNAVNFSDNVEMIVGALDRQQGIRVADRGQADPMSLYRRR